MEDADRIREVYDGFNRREFERAADVFSETATLLNIPTGELQRGRAGYLHVARSWAAAFPDGRVEILQMSVEGDHAHVEYVLRGRHTGSFVTPRGHVPPTGLEVDLRLCDVIALSGGQVDQLRTYFDGATLLRQLGLLANSPLHSPERRAPLELFAQEMDSTLPQRNKAVVRRFIAEVFNRHNPAAAADTCAPRIRWHGGPLGEMRGLAALQQLLAGIFRAFPDLQVEVEEEIAQNDLVAARVAVTGTHLGDFQSVPPTGKRVSGSGTNVYRLEDGRIAEEWWQMDLLSLMQQIEGAPKVVGMSAGE